MSVSTILYWSGMCVTMWVILSSDVLTSVGPNTMARFRGSIWHNDKWEDETFLPFIYEKQRDCSHSMHSCVLYAQCFNYWFQVLLCMIHLWTLLYSSKSKNYFYQALLFLSYPLRSIHKIKSHHFWISYFTHKMKWVANFIPCLPLEKNLKIISPSLKIWQKACNLKHVSRALYYVFFSILLHVILLFLNESAHSVCVCTVHPKIVLPCSFLNFQPQFWDVPRGTSVFHNGDRAAREAGEWEVYSRLP